MKRILTILAIVMCLMPVSAQAMGEVQSTSEAKRIVSLGPNVTEIIYELGAGDQLVGRTDYCNYPQEALSVPSIGTLWEPNLEKILSLDADIAIASSIVDPSFMESLSKAGIETYQFYEETSLEGTYRLIQEIADAIGMSQKGKLLVEDVESRIEAVSAKVSSIAEAERKSVIYMISWGDWGDYAATGDTYLNDVIKAAGAVNAAEDGAYWSVSRELLLEKDPDAVLLGEYSYTDRSSTLLSFIACAPYTMLSASQNGNVYFIDGDAAERQGVRTADTVEAIARLLYPELF